MKMYAPIENKMLANINCMSYTTILERKYGIVL